MLTLKTTPFHERTSALMEANQWRRWSGYSVASAYEMTHDREYLAMREACALLDVSPLCKYHVSGPDAGAFLNRLVTRDLSRLAVGQGAYTPWCDSRGKVVDDGTVARLGESFYRLTAAETNYLWLTDNATGFDVTVEDVSERIGTLALQGPCSRDVLARAAGEAVRELKFYRWMEAAIDGRTVGISRTGYSGDLGYEIWVDAKDAGKAGGCEGGQSPPCAAVWDAVLREGRAYAIQPAGIWALDVARIEAGLIMLDVDYTPAPKAILDSQASSPFELGLGWAVHFQKGNFVGRKALLQEQERGSPLALVGLEIDHEALSQAYESLGMPPILPFIPWREITPIFSEHEQVGYATCGGWSPTLKRYLALAQVAPRCAGEGTRLRVELLVDRWRKSFEARVGKLPFFNPERKRS
ncbi:MAG: aminomethyltransferase family protein [Candidatus Eremiobacterota bacterium]